MGWSNVEEPIKKKGMDLSSKILLGIISCVILIIILIAVLLINIQNNIFNVILNGETLLDEEVPVGLLTNVDGATYIQIEAFSNLVDYEYHKGEYKSFTIEEDKCYVQGLNETATFILNDNKIYKLPVDEMTEDYREYTIEEGIVKEIDGKMYAPIDAIRLAFNVELEVKEKSLTINTLDTVVKYYDTKVQSWGYASILEQDFENTKSMLYGYIIVKKENGLYKIINTTNTEEIVSDKYNSIEFIENTKEFFVTNSLGKVGIINLDGTTKIEPIYDSIEVLDKKSDLYLVQKDSKYGVVKSGNLTVIYPEYDSIGIDTEEYEIVDSKYILLNELIPVSKDGKYGAFNKKGELVYKLEYEKFGCNISEVETNGIKKVVKSVITIPECNGIVVFKNERYGVKNLKGENLVSVSVESIYKVEKDNKETEYYMIYDGEELNIIEQLIKAGLLEDKNKKDKDNNTQVNNSINNNITNSVSSENTISNSSITNNY